ncbi:ABC transporter permease [Thermodesulfobacteriota bacterium]
MINYQKTFILTLALALFALIALAPVAALFSSLISLKLDISVWSWLIRKQVFPLTLNSLYVAFVASFVALVIGLPLGLAIGSHGKPLSSGFFLLFFLPLAIPPYLTASCWMDILGRSGILPGLAHKWLGMEGSSSWLGGGWGAGIILGFSYFPILVYLVISGLRALDPRHEEVGMFALPEASIFRNITLPLLFPHISTGLLLIFLLSLTNYAVPSLVGFRTFTVKIYAYFSVFAETGGAVLLSLPLLLICLAAVFLLSYIMKDRVYFSLERSREGGSTLRLLQAKTFRVFSYGPALLITAVPILSLVFRAESFLNLKIGFDQAKVSMISSFVTAFLISLFLTILAFFIGYASERIRHFKTGWGRALLLFPFALPSVLLAIGVIWLWNRPGLHWAYQSILILTILWGAKYLPLAQRIVADHIGQLPAELEEIAFLSQFSWIRSLYRIVWPLTRPGFFVAWTVTYIFCLSELGGTLLVIPPGWDTMPIRLYNVMHYGSSSLVAALGLFLIIMAVLPLTLLYIFGKKMHRFRYSDIEK